MELQELVQVFRSKNAGPLYVTVDLVFADEAAFRYTARHLTQARAAQAYGIDERKVVVIVYPPSHSIKVVITRPAPAGSMQDTDLYGAQQHMPLMRLPLPDDAAALHR